MTPEKRQQFCKDLEHLINRYSLENGSNTPDFLLAEYLADCLEVFETSIQRREQWWGRGPGHSLKVEEPSSV
jgi:hypothetical protein